MKHGICIALCAIFITLTAQAQRAVLPLEAGWTFRKYGDTSWMQAKVPGCVHTDLMRNSAIADPFYGTNEQDVQWVEREDWEYQNIFYLSGKWLKHDHVELQFAGLDTYADVYLNDSLILRADNMFRSWNIDVKDHVRKGANTLYIRFYSPVNKANALEAASEYAYPPDERVFVRKAQYQFGWDWGPRLVTSGIWKPVQLVAHNDMFVRREKFQYTESDNDTARISIELDFQAGDKHNYEIQVRELNTGTMCYSHKYTDHFPTAEVLRFDFAIPARWKPHGMGDQHLYQFEVTVRHHQHTYFHKRYTTGFSNIRLHEEKDATGKSFYFTVDGKPVFIKGANWIPMHSFPTQNTREDYRRLLTEARNMHINMLRVWGGGYYEDDAFYQLCDSLGIMVWQDFMFACAMYPYQPENQLEFDEQVRRLKLHPCIGLWCGNNEIDEGWMNWGWQKQMGYSDADSAHIKQTNDQIFRHDIPEALYISNGVQQSYHPSSPTHGWGRKESMTEGDAHYWGVWWGKQPFSIFNEKVPRFMSEYGFQGMPSMNSYRQFIPADALSLGSAAVKQHQKHPTGFETIATYMQRDYPIPEAFDDYIYISQLLQADGMRTAIEAHRRNRPYCMGTMFWQLNDCWPVASWSVIDHYGNRKAAYYTVEQTYRDALISVHQYDNKIETWLVNDLDRARAVTLTYRLLRTDGRMLDSNTVEVSLPPAASTLFTTLDIPYFLKGADRSRCVLYIQLWEGETCIAERSHLFVPPAKLHLQKPNIQVSVSPDGTSLTVQSDTYVRQAYLYTDNRELLLSDNFFDLLPNAPKQISLQPSPEGIPAAGDIRIKCLNFLHSD